MALADVIETVSNYRVESGSTDNMTDAQLSLLTSLTSERVTRLNPGFTSNELDLFTAYIILDAWENRTPQVTDKTVKDTRWKVKGITSTSRWMDLALQMIVEYKNPQNSAVSVSGVARCDSLIQGLDNTTVTQWGDYSDAL